MQEPPRRRSETRPGGWLVSWGRLTGFLACWNRRHSFGSRHREAERGKPCRASVQIQGIYGAIETGAGDLPGDPGDLP